MWNVVIQIRSKQKKKNEKDFIWHDRMLIAGQNVCYFNWQVYDLIQNKNASNTFYLRKITLNTQTQAHPKA